MLAQIQEEYPNDVRIVYRHFPLTSIHDKAALSTQASEAAGIQGEFWAMHDLLYARQSEWAGLSVEEFQQWVIAQTEELNIDTEQFSADLLSKDVADLTQAAWDRGVEIGMPGTPFLLVNGRIWPNNLPMDKNNISAIIELDLLEDRQFTECPPMTIDQEKQYIATIETEKGDIVIELYSQQAPIAVNNFIFLAQNGWYDDVIFHRVLPDFVAQAGDPTASGLGGPGYAFVNEISEDLRFDKAGVVGMANSGPDTNGSQFFITYSQTPNLDGGYTIFGQVIAGMDVVESLTSRDPSQPTELPPGDKIITVTIEEK